MVGMVTLILPGGCRCGGGGQEAKEGKEGWEGWAKKDIVYNDGTVSSAKKKKKKKQRRKRRG